MTSSPSGSPPRTLIGALEALHEQEGEPAARPPARQGTGWGRLPASVRVHRSERLAELTRGAVLTRGLGRSYGDAALPPADRSEVAGTTLADRILAFDPATGVLRCEAGLRLGELIRLLLPRGFFPPVVPGTQEVTIGGLVAADVHGKNHHRDGTFGEHVTELLLQLGGGKIVACSPMRNAELFWATIGGMGLTGHILEIEVRLQRVPSPWIHAEREAWTELPGMLTALRAAGAKWPFTAGWVDLACRGRAFGRGLLYRGRWASPEEAPSQPPRPRRPWHLPLSPPSGLIRPSTARLFNSMVFAAGSWRSPSVAVVSPESFFFPLDTIADWHRLYGRRGLTQYQCVLPDAAGPGAVAELVALLRDAPLPVALCVVKDCGAAGHGLLSFPMPGLTLAADLPIGPGLQETIDRLNDLVAAAGGRIYLAKDAFTRARHYRAMEPRLAAWQEIRQRWNGEDAPRSALSVRLCGDRS